ncbi:MAG: hypothetical protein JW839_10315 [Candidatus Lokiarchaeota archaeon]|nr:hypothetical protein [Candidatus Lokiarchaeota archaeon]
MARVLDAIGTSVSSPETAWSVLSPHRATRVVVIVVGLLSFSRLVTVILDVHRAAVTGLADEGIIGMVLGTLARGSVWHSLVIASAGLSAIIAGCLASAVAISRAGHKSAWGHVFLELMAAATVRLPIIAGLALVLLFFTGTVYVVESTVSLAIWVAGFGVALLEFWRVSGKVAARNEARPWVGFVAAMLASIAMAAVTVGITYLIGGLE